MVATGGYLASSRFYQDAPSDRPRGMIQEASVHDQLPTVGHFGVDLAGPAFPVKVAAIAATPQSIDVNHREGTVTFLRNNDTHNLASVVDKPVCVEERLPATNPAIAVVASPLQDPAFGIVGLGIGRPWPYHVRMEDREKQIDILSVPSSRFSMDDFLDLGLQSSHS